jgi:phosphatidylglycerophosphatase A
MESERTSRPGAARRGPRAESALAVLTLSAFGLGLSPFMPGTVGSLGTVLALGFLPATMAKAAALLVLLFLFGVGVTMKFAGRIQGPDGHGDPGWVVSDEVAGQALACLPAVLLGAGWAGLGVAFVLFRLFDIWKPGPVGWAERLPGALGVLMDDIVAGAFAALGTTALCLSPLVP